MKERSHDGDGSPNGVYIDGAWHHDWYALFEDEWFAEWVRKHEITVPFFELRNGLYRAIERVPEGEHALSVGHWYKGGQARWRLMRRFGIPCPTPRDTDLIRDETVALFRSPPSPVLAQADDIEPYGGLYDDDEGGLVFSEDDLEAYFHQRDFTVNQVLANGREILFTKEALIAAKLRVLNPTPFEWEAIERSTPQAVKQLARALRFSIEWSVDPRHIWQIHPKLMRGLGQEDLDANPFYPFLHLDRILERGYAYGDLFLHAWHELGFFAEEKTVMDLAIRLAKGIWGDYRPSSPYLQEREAELPLGSATRRW